MKTIPYGRQLISNADIYHVVKALKKEKITTGNTIKQFEEKINNYLGCKYSTTCNSGTSAIFIALQSIELKKK